MEWVSQLLKFVSISLVLSWGQVGIKSGIKHVIYQKLASFMQKKDIYGMVADLKVGSLTFKYVFHRPEHNAKGGIP